MHVNTVWCDSTLRSGMRSFSCLMWGITWYNGINLLCWGCVQRYIYIYNPTLPGTYDLCSPLPGNIYIYIYISCKKHAEPRNLVLELIHSTSIYAVLCSRIFLGPKISRLKRRKFWLAANTQLMPWISPESQTNNIDGCSWYMHHDSTCPSRCSM